MTGYVTFGGPMKRFTHLVRYELQRSEYNVFISGVAKGVLIRVDPLITFDVVNYSLEIIPGIVIVSTGRCEHSSDDYRAAATAKVHTADTVTACIAGKLSLSGPGVGCNSYLIAENCRKVCCQDITSNPARREDLAHHCQP